MSDRLSRLRTTISRRHLGVEALESRALLAATPTIRLCECADTGVKDDGITYAATPRFKGTATPRAQLTLALDGGATLGLARANAFGEWEFTARKVRVPDGIQTIRITEKGPDGSPTGTATTTVTFDRAKPTASITRDGNTFSVDFSQAVTGFNGELNGLVLSGRPIGSRPFTVALSSQRVRAMLGDIQFTPQPNGTTYVIQILGQPIPAGTYTLRLNAMRSGIMASVSGARLTANMTYTFTV